MAARWRDLETDEPEFAGRVRRLLGARKHMTLATLRSDGSPRISGTELEFRDGDLRIGMMKDSRKAHDVLRDPRVAIHGPTEDPPEDDNASWVGEAKVSGRAVADDPQPEDAHSFRIDIDEVVLTKLAPTGDHLVIESWHPGRGLEEHHRF